VRSAAWAAARHKGLGAAEGSVLRYKLSSEFDASQGSTMNIRIDPGHAYTLESA
jgi:hypothetical protein